MRKAGILMPIASLPSKYGVGDFGSSSYEFVDLISESGFKIWQILPLNPLGYGSSPYQAYSSYAMDEIYLSLDFLKEEGLILSTDPYFDSDRIDYDRVRKYKEFYLKEAFNKFKASEDYFQFIKMDWVYKYAVFLTLKKENNLKCWNEWEKSHKDWILNQELDLSNFQDKINYEMFIQYNLYKQWLKLKKYANAKGVEVMGDIPFYVGIDSDDVWTNQKSFLLDDDGRPIFIAGVPPDYFSKTGQRWGNPIYDWEYIEKNDFSFWLNRLGYNKNLFDIIRIDHFRAFDTYWRIESSCPTAIDGVWLEAPGYKLFDKLFSIHPDIKIIAEDLGDLRPEVLILRDHYKFKGMRIVQFTFDPLNDEEDVENLVIYTGTHDNQTIYSWYSGLESEKQLEINEFFIKNNYNQENVVLNFVDYTLNSNAEIAIIPLYDILSLDDNARLNTPGTLGELNWTWKLNDFQSFKEMLPILKKSIIKYNR